MAIYIDEPRKDGLFKMHRIRPTGYGSGPKDGILDLDRFDVQEVDSSTTRFWFLNQRPIYNAEGKIEKRKIGANTTIDVYEHRKRDKEMRYIGSSWSSKLHSPNSIAFMGANNFVVSNDRSGQTGLRRKLDPLLGGGSLVYYDDWSDRYTTTPKTLPIAGSIVRGHDDQVYVPSVVNDKVGVFQLQDDGTFRQARQIAVGLPVAGLSVDSRDDIWAVGRNKYDPTGLESQHSIIRIRQTEYRSLRYITEKILEDGDGISLKAASVARHDVKTKRIFIAGKFNYRYQSHVAPTKLGQVTLLLVSQSASRSRSRSRYCGILVYVTQGPCGRSRVKGRLPTNLDCSSDKRGCGCRTLSSPRGKYQNPHSLCITYVNAALRHASFHTCR
jgi:hypothetical protein